MKPKKLADGIVTYGLDYALKHQPDAEKRTKAYRKAAFELLLLAAEMENDSWS